MRPGAPVASGWRPISSAQRPADWGEGGRRIGGGGRRGAYGGADLEATDLVVTDGMGAEQLRRRGGCACVAAAAAQRVRACVRSRASDSVSACV